MAKMLDFRMFCQPNVNLVKTADAKEMVRSAHPHRLSAREYLLFLPVKGTRLPSRWFECMALFLWDQALILTARNRAQTKAVARMMTTHAPLSVFRKPPATWFPAPVVPVCIYCHQTASVVLQGARRCCLLSMPRPQRHYAGRGCRWIAAVQFLPHFLKLRRTHFW